MKKNFFVQLLGVLLLGLLLGLTMNSCKGCEGDTSKEYGQEMYHDYNGVLPKSNFITLRRPVGPTECNPRWTFGDEYDVLFIDAVTGEITDNNPAFSRQ